MGVDIKISTKTTLSNREKAKMELNILNSGFIKQTKYHEISFSTLKIRVESQDDQIVLQTKVLTMVTIISSFQSTCTIPLFGTIESRIIQKVRKVNGGVDNKHRPKN